MRDTRELADTNARIVGFNLHEQGDDEAVVYYSMPVDSWENKLREMGAVRVTPWPLLVH